MTDFYTPDLDRIGLEPLPDAQEGLPDVLLIGDSISIGYTRPVAQMLRGRANVRRPAVNCGDTRRGLEQLDDWLGGVKWDLVHFNWGLHDLCYRHPDATVYGNRDKVNGEISVPLEEYRENLQALVERIKAASDGQIWASTTVVPEGEPGRHAGDEERYNEAAAEVMAGCGVVTNDLHALTTSFDDDLFVGPGDVHFTEAGSRRLAEQVAATIEGMLKQA
ncbi:MAG: SGNH/GDSL hydrolase family protein [Phycisphaeraceae bacterium]|nr:SGNH/GDSL hydrolase family protein [Phycisphaeraceae bacterium]